MTKLKTPIRRLAERGPSISIFVLAFFEYRQTGAGVFDHDVA